MVSKALNDLLNHIKHGGHVEDDVVDAILSATDKLFNSMGNAAEMVRILYIYTTGSSWVWHNSMEMHKHNCV